MNSVTDKKNEEGRKKLDSMKHVERKLVDRGVGRMERHPADGLPLKHDPKKGHGSKYTWEGPAKEYFEAEALDPEVEVEEGSDELVVGEVEVAKTADNGVARIELHPHLKIN